MEKNCFEFVQENEEDEGLVVRLADDGEWAAEQRQSNQTEAAAGSNSESKAAEKARARAREAAAAPWCCTGLKIERMGVPEMGTNDGL